jgi:ABC exporter DevB family membrane fusion protein
MTVERSDVHLGLAEAPEPAEREEPFGPGGGLGPADFGPAPRSRWRAAGIVIFGVLLIAASLAYYGVRARRAGTGAGPVTVTHGVIQRVIAGKGKIEPRAELRVTASMLGRIKAILVNEGAEVTRGQVLVQMDDQELRARLLQAVAALDEARAGYADLAAGARPQELEGARARERETAAVLGEARTSLDRARALFGKGVIPRSQIDEADARYGVALAQNQSAREQLSLIESGARDDVRRAAEAQVKRAEAEVALARTLLDQTTIRAPVAGRVIERFMQPGEVIVLQRPQPILTLADLSRIQVRAEVDEGDARFLKAGQTAEITSSAFPGRTFKGTLVEIGETAGRKDLTSDDPSEMVDTKVVEAIIELTDTHPWTFGVTVDVAIVAERRENVLVVPRAAVSDEGGQASVMVRTGESYTRRPISLGA